jgi:hypothetical protein
MSTNYKLPFTLTPRVLALVAVIGEVLGRMTGSAKDAVAARLGPWEPAADDSGIAGHRAQLSHAGAGDGGVSGRRVPGAPKEIQEVRKAFGAPKQAEA